MSNIGKLNFFPPIQPFTAHIHEKNDKEFLETERRRKSNELEFPALKSFLLWLSIGNLFSRFLSMRCRFNQHRLANIYSMNWFSGLMKKRFVRNQSRTHIFVDFIFLEIMSVILLLIGLIPTNFLNLDIFEFLFG